MLTFEEHLHTYHCCHGYWFQKCSMTCLWCYKSVNSFMSQVTLLIHGDNIPYDHANLLVRTTLNIVMNIYFKSSNSKSISVTIFTPWFFFSICTYFHQVPITTEAVCHQEREHYNHLSARSCTPGRENLAEEWSRSPNIK